MVTRITSIGAGTTHDASLTSITGVTGSGTDGSPWVVTCTVAADTVVGDALWDEHSTPRKYAIVAVGASDVSVIDSEGVGAQPDSSATSTPQRKRYYNGSTPITDWESELSDTNKYPTGSDTAEGRIYNDAALDESVTLNYTGRTYLLTVPDGERHDGTDGTGARIVRSVNTTQIFNSSSTWEGDGVDWLEFDANGKTMDYLANVSKQAYRWCILHGLAATSSNWYNKALRASNTDSDALNCIVYDIASARSGGSGDPTGIDNFGEVKNCTVADVSSSAGTKTVNGIVGTTVTNCISVNNTSDGTANDYGTITTPSYNLSEDTTASGTGSLTSQSAAQFVSASAPYDLHLTTGVSAIDAGTDLGTTPSGVEIDIDGRDRDASADTWDMGADEFVAAGGGGLGIPIAAYHYIHHLGTMG